MPKKNFKGVVKGADKLFSIHDIPDTAQTLQENHETQTVHDISTVRNNHATQDVHATRATQDVHATRATRTERLNIRIDSELKKYINEAAWLQRMSITEYILNLVEADKKAQESRIKEEF